MYYPFFDALTSIEMGGWYESCAPQKVQIFSRHNKIVRSIENKKEHIHPENWDKRFSPEVFKKTIIIGFGEKSEK